mgnify:CR=1 FL=1
MNDIPQCIEETTRKARKQHMCCECGVLIKSGQQYRYISGIWDGKPLSYKQCLACADRFQRETNNADYPDEGPWFTGLYEYIEISEPCNQ